MLVEITAAYKSFCINDIVVSLFPACAGMNRVRASGISEPNLFPACAGMNRTRKKT